MNTLPDLLNIIVTTLQTSLLFDSVKVVETSQFSESQFLLKVRAQLSTGKMLQIRVYQNGEHIDYAYQMFSGDQGIIRWDNKEHFPVIATHPHHFHSSTGVIQDSELVGDPVRDLLVVLELIASDSDREE